MAILAPIGVWLAANASWLVPTAAAAVSTGVGVASAQSTAAASKEAIKQEGQYAEAAAIAEAEAQRQEDRRTAAHQKSIYSSSGVSTTEGSPLFVDLQTARTIGQRYDDRRFRGQLGAAEGRLQIPMINAQRTSRNVQAGTSLATELYKTFR